MTASYLVLPAAGNSGLSAAVPINDIGIRSGNKSSGMAARTP